MVSLVPIVDGFEFCVNDRPTTLLRKVGAGLGGRRAATAALLLEAKGRAAAKAAERISPHLLLLLRCCCALLRLCSRHLHGKTAFINCV